MKEPAVPRQWLAYRGCQWPGTGQKSWTSKCLSDTPFNIFYLFLIFKNFKKAFYWSLACLKLLEKITRILRTGGAIVSTIQIFVCTFLCQCCKKARTNIIRMKRNWISAQGLVWILQLLFSPSWNHLVYDWKGWKMSRIFVSVLSLGCNFHLLLESRQGAYFPCVSFFISTPWYIMVTTAYESLGEGCISGKALASLSWPILFSPRLLVWPRMRSSCWTILKNTRVLCDAML